MLNRALSTIIGFGLFFSAQAAGVTSPVVEKSPFELRYPDASLLSRYVGRAADAALSQASDTDFVDAVTQADAALMLIGRYGTARDIDAFREAAFARRLIHQVAESPEAGRDGLLKYLQAHPALAHTLVFAVTEKNDLPAVYALLDKLRTERPQQLADFPELAVALCTVRDRELGRHINENYAAAVDPITVFDFYVAHENQMFYGLHGVPVELLAYVVDNTNSVADMQWAMNKYAGNRDIGSLFFTINYDYDYLAGTADKKLDKAPGGFGLPNILQFGGVCIDQAYFAVSVGKSIGIPSTMVLAASAEAGHAWVGFLKPVGKSAAWDFNSGRYEAFQGIRGNVTNPQTGENIADSTVGLLGDLIGTNATQRQNAAAVVDAAKLLNATVEKLDPPAYPAELLVARPPSKKILKAPAARPATADGQLDLIELGLRQFVAYPAGWNAVAGLAREGKLSEAQKRKWAELVQRLCGQKHPDFAVAILSPMIETVDDVNEQSGLWDNVYHFVQARPDLAAEVRFRQARLWERHQEFAKAGQYYTDVLQHDVNAGPFALRALSGAEEILQKLGKDDRVLTLYASAAKAVTKPDLSTKSGFIHSSNWYKIREAYAAKLSDAGRTQEADQIRSEDR